MGLILEEVTGFGSPMESAAEVLQTALQRAFLCSVILVLPQNQSQAQVST